MEAEARMARSCILLVGAKIPCLPLGQVRTTAAAVGAEGAVGSSRDSSVFCLPAESSSKQEMSRDRVEQRSGRLHTRSGE